VPDVSAAISCYTGVLGFTDSWEYGTPPTHGGASFGRAAVQFSLDPDLAERCRGLSYFFLTTAESAQMLDALCAAMASRGGEIVVPPSDFPWGYREFTVGDCHGYRLRFAGPPHRQASVVDGVPQDVRIVDRRPTPQEYATLIRAVGWEALTPLDRVGDLLAPTMQCVVAERGDGGEVVGCALLLHDGVSFGYLKDVMVLPAWQRRGIGRALVEQLLRWAEQNLPATALLTLFTGRALTPFYQQWRFLTPEDGLLGMSRRVGS
jgi:GNAT superfamily N-acetyltransferase/uncharacterized glyoxalase superfamily protein PhnB